MNLSNELLQNIYLKLVENSYSAPLAAIVTAAVLYTARNYIVSSSVENRLKRSVSFSSEAMLDGAFPPNKNVQQPIVNALFFVDECPSVEELVKKIRVLSYYDRMRSGVKNINGKWEFIDLGSTNSFANGIIKTLTFPNEIELRQTVDGISMEEIPLVETLPLMRFYRLINEGDGKSAIFCRIHHAIGDGIAMVGAMSRLFENENGDPFQIDIPEKMGGGSKFRLKFGFIIRFVRSLFEVLMLPNSRYDSDTLFFGPHAPSLVMSKRRQSIDFPILKLEFIKKIKNKAEVTVNDVMMSVTSGMIRRYCAAKGDPNIKSLDVRTRVFMRALLPVAFPRPKKDLMSPDQSMRNLWSFVSAPLAVNETTAKDRLGASARITRRLKRSPQALIQLFLQNNCMRFLPSFLSRQIAFDAFSRHSIVFSNLPGPAHKVSICGRPVLGFQVIFPNILPQVIILSYAGGIHFTLCMDPDEIELDLLPRYFMEELRELANSLGIPATQDEMFLNPSQRS